MIVCIPDVLDLTELRRIRNLAAAESFTDGRATAGHRAKLVKKNLQIRKDATGAVEIKGLIVAGLTRNPVFQRVAIPKSVQSPLVSRYETGMEYGRHVDDALMVGSRGGSKSGASKVRTDLSVTLFLSDPGDYDGGELVIQTAHDEQEVKLPAGAAVVYPSGALHRVAPVIRGVRLAAATWVESYVRDPTRREILHDLDLIRRKLSKASPSWEETDLAYKSYANLLRMWSET